MEAIDRQPEEEVGAAAHDPSNDFVAGEVAVSEQKVAVLEIAREPASAPLFPLGLGDQHKTVAQAAPQPDQADQQRLGMLASAVLIARWAICCEQFLVGRHSHDCAIKAQETFPMPAPATRLRLLLSLYERVEQSTEETHGQNATGCAKRFFGDRPLALSPCSFCVFAFHTIANRHIFYIDRRTVSSAITAIEVDIFRPG